MPADDKNASEGTQRVFVLRQLVEVLRSMARELLRARMRAHLT